ncbi:hypothetical protein MBOT_11330 [Mycobacterium botniense]|uniref:Uncharacterized protein n=1 Tax=Mycobacterium botniense TaxID=84962 RepID=A0A7I9XV36_9MYCO|nr:hypothetical protein MBOT_11330 [Mycobacterium botniense]
MPFRDTERRTGVTLRVQVDDQGFKSLNGERGCEVDGCCCFTDAAFLVRDGEEAPVSGAWESAVRGMQNLHCALCLRADRGIEFVGGFT